MSLTVYKKGNKKVIFSKNDYKATGGEGVIYIQGTEVFKIFLKIPNPSFANKISELKMLDKPNILRPLDLLYNNNGEFIGFTMYFQRDTTTMPPMFTNGYRRRNNITPDMTVELVNIIAEIIQYIHDKKCLIVDMNELNFLICKLTHKIPYFIDVDSYETPSFPATAIMDSIRDFTTNKFSRETDWFSFGILALQLFIGIHPYKGRHASFNDDDIKARQLAHVSIFNKDVRLPPPVRDLSLIPGPYLDWFKKVFEEGKRMAPPTVTGGQQHLKAKIKVLIGSNNILLIEVLSCDEDILRCEFKSGIRIVYTGSKVYIGKNTTHIPIDINSEFIFSPVSGNPLEVGVDKNDMLLIRDVLTMKSLCVSPLKAQRIMVIKNRLYVINNGKLTEIKIRELGGKTIPVCETSWDILPNSSQFFNNMIVSDALGTKFFYFLYAEGKCLSIKAPNEIQPYNIINAKYENGVVILIGFKSGKYDRIIIKYQDERFQNWNIDIEPNIMMSDINFISFRKGEDYIIVELKSNDELEISTLKSDTKKVLKNVGLGQVPLCNNLADVFIYQGSKLYQLKTK